MLRKMNKRVSLNEQNGLRSTGINLLISLKLQPFCMAFLRFWRISTFKNFSFKQSEKLPQRLNKEIRNKKINLGALIPVTVSLQMLDFMSSMENLSFTAGNCLLVLMLHTIGYTCNNLVGTIYVKDKDDSENQNVIISYINYWGKRIDLRTTVDDIIPFTENFMNTSNSLYKILKIKSCKQTLKVYTKYGKVTEEASFSNIFG
ncbi:uncharacterized protein LOC117161419 isoform X2 [Bombus vancouverensis nearcticus]|uniref:uncharacterized protein LOC117161419 isoform X2 n=1 Tax=Bombus vancouverensis nearcticus TaxID=2705178 RepID=UPI00402B7629